MFRSNPSRAAKAPAATASAGPQNGDYPSRRQQQHEESNRTSFQSNRSSFQSNRLFRLASHKTTSSTNTSSKNTAFYSAESYLSTNHSTSSFHTAELPLAGGNNDNNDNNDSEQLTANSPPPPTDTLSPHLITPDPSPPVRAADSQVPRAAIASKSNSKAMEYPTHASSGSMSFPTESPDLQQQREFTEDADLVHAMARQYVIDAEAAGSASPSQRSRNTTDASKNNLGNMVRSLGGDVTSSSEDFPPQLPPLHHTLGTDNRSSSINNNDDDSGSNANFYMMRDSPRDAAAAQANSVAVSAQQRFSDRSQQQQGLADAMIKEKPSTDDANAEYEDSITESTDLNRNMSERIHDEEFEDDANEARHFVPARMRYPPPKYEIRTDSSIPLGAVLFLLGFLILPLWWVGILFPRKQDTEVAKTWRKYNSLMTLLSLPLLGLFLGLGGWQAAHDD
ncbi:hypothetical protein GQ54DRAFT_194523 [Martensiomyces pterosporus]|nr:hypothetical protein GQ54DRAFT_194523 [Martensiomyces pterosporus]